MASVTGLSKIGLPHLSENMDAEDARAIRNYLYPVSYTHLTLPTIYSV